METKRIVGRTGKAVILVLAVLAAAERAQASGPLATQLVQEVLPRPIEGVWLPTVTITDCATEAVIASFPSMEIYVRGGGYIGFGAVTQADQIGMGAWRHTGGRNYAAQYQFFGYQPFGAPDGTPDGTLLKVSATIRLSTDGRTFTSTETAALLDASGNVLFRTCGHREARRLQ